MNSIFILFACAVFCTPAQTQTTGAQLMYIFTGQPPPYTYPNQLISTDQPNLIRDIRFAERVCVSGKWIFYNQPNYGIGLEDDPDISATVIPAGPPGSAARDCLPAAATPDLGLYRSLRAISGPNPTTTTLTVFSESNYLGIMRNIVGQVTVADGIRVGSFIFSKGTTVALWELCASQDCLTGPSICLDSRFLDAGTSISDSGDMGSDPIVNLDDDTEPVVWPRIIRAVRVLQSVNACSQNAQHIGSEPLRVAYMQMKKMLIEENH